MKKKIAGFILGVTGILMCFSGCGTSELSEKEIISNLPEHMMEIYVDSQVYELEVKEFDIWKRKIEEDTDEIYFNMELGCEEYQVSRDGYLYYVLYDEGGWILEDYFDDLVGIEPLIGVEQAETDAEMASYYFDTYSFVDHQFDKDTNTSYSVYDVTYDCDNYSYDGQVTMVSTFSENGTYTAGVWDKKLSYEDNFDWNIIGSWAADGSDFSEGRSFRKIAFEISVDAVDQSAGTIDFSARLYDCGLTDREVNIYKADDKSESVVVDYAGTEYLAYVKPVFDEAMTEEAKYKAPTLSFRTYVEENEVIIKYEPYKATIHIGGYGGAYGNLQPGYSIRTWNNAEFGYIEMEKN